MEFWENGGHLFLAWGSQPHASRGQENTINARHRLGIEEIGGDEDQRNGDHRCPR